MDVTIMHSTSSILERLRNNYPQFTFQNASVSRWSPIDKTVYFASTRGRGSITLLHELGHALRDHQSYHQDIELLRCEREAWETARAIAPTYGITITDAIVTDALTTYRQWLHDRSRCPRCENAGAQLLTSLAYRCPLCDLEWHANDARQCGLRRYSQKQFSVDNSQFSKSSQ